MANWKKVIILRTLFYIVCTVPTSVTILFYFDVWTAERALSGITVMLFVIVLSVFWRRLAEKLKSPALWQVAGFLLVFFTVSKKIADKLDVILWVFFLSSLLGAVIWNIAENYSQYGRATKPIAVVRTPEEYRK